MGTEVVVGLVLALLFGGAGFAYGGFELTSVHPFLAVLSYVIAIGCVAGALVVGIVAPIKSVAKREKDKLENVDTAITPQYLVSLFKGRTDLQGQNLIKEHLGTEVTVSGKIRSIEPQPAFSRLRMIVEHEPVVVAYFDSTWTERLTALYTGDKISLTGKVDSIAQGVVLLENCKIVSVLVARRS
jgi:hypothetical protein